MAGDDSTADTERLDVVRSDDARPTRPSGGRRAVTVVVTAVALLAAGALGAALAAGVDQQQELSPAVSAAAPDPSASARTEMFRHRGDGLKLRFRHGLGLGGAPLHGELVLPEPDGDGYRTVVVQRGEVTAVSGRSLTVRSEDGFSQTYRLTAATTYFGGLDGASSLQDGDQVHVAGVRAGGAVRAAHVADLSRLQDRSGGLHHRLGDRPRDNAPDRT